MFRFGRRTYSLVLYCSSPSSFPRLHSMLLRGREGRVGVTGGDRIWVGGFGLSSGERDWGSRWGWLGCRERGAVWVPEHFSPSSSLHFLSSLFLCIRHWGMESWSTRAVVEGWATTTSHYPTLTCTLGKPTTLLALACLFGTSGGPGYADS